MRVECFSPHSSFWEILVQVFGVLGGRGVGAWFKHNVRLRGVFTTKNQIFRFLIFWRGVLLQILDKINKKLNFSTFSLLCAHLGTET